MYTLQQQLLLPLTDAEAIEFSDQGFYPGFVRQSGEATSEALHERAARQPPPHPSAHTVHQDSSSGNRETNEVAMPEVCEQSCSCGKRASMKTGGNSSGQP